MNYLGSINVHVLTKSIRRNNGRKHTSQEQQSYLYLFFVTIPTTKHHKIRFDQDQDKINHITHTSISVTRLHATILFFKYLTKRTFKNLFIFIDIHRDSNKKRIIECVSQNIIVQCLLICSCSMNIFSHIRFW